MKKGIIGLLICINTMIALLIFDYYNPFVNMMRDKYVESLTVKTYGTVTKYTVYQTRGSSKSLFDINMHYIDITYEVDGKTYEINNTFRGGKKQICNIGDQIYILYNPKNLKNGAVPENIVDWQKQNKKDFKVRIITPIIIEVLLCTMHFIAARKEKNRINHYILDK